MSTVEVKTADLIGTALDWAVGVTNGWAWGPPHRLYEWDCWRDTEGNIVGPMPAQAFRPSTSWEHGGPLIDRHDIHFNAVDCTPLGLHGFRAFQKGDLLNSVFGETRLIAACRAIVAANLGNAVQVPAELMP